MNRRVFIQLTAGLGMAALAGCELSDGDSVDLDNGNSDDGTNGDDVPGPISDIPPDVEEPTEYVTMYSMYAIALYYDGTHGPITGEITTDYFLEDEDVEFPFWHGHGGVQHAFTLTRDDMAKIKNGERVVIPTTEVDSHSHTLFIDPTNPEYRMPGAEPVLVAL